MGCVTHISIWNGGGFDHSCRSKKQILFYILNANIPCSNNYSFMETQFQKYLLGCALPLTGLTSFPPVKSAILEELECRQIWCSPGVCDVKVKRPSAPYCLDRTTCTMQQRAFHYAPLLQIKLHSQLYYRMH